MAGKRFGRTIALLAAVAVISSRPGPGDGAEASPIGRFPDIYGVGDKPPINGKINDAEGSSKFESSISLDSSWSGESLRPYPRYTTIRFELCLFRDLGLLDKLCRDRHAKAFDPHPRQPTAYLTWGSPGITVGGRARVQAIITSASSGPNGRQVTTAIRHCFGDEYGTLRSLLPLRDFEAGSEIRQVARIKDRRNQWYAAFACLGSIPEIQNSYDAETRNDGVWTSNGRDSVLEPIQEVRIHEQQDGLVKRRSMRRIMARRMKAATVRA
jgi:hypothetical protein